VCMGLWGVHQQFIFRKKVGVVTTNNCQKIEGFEIWKEGKPSVIPWSLKLDQYQKFGVPKEVVPALAIEWSKFMLFQCFMLSRCRHCLRNWSWVFQKVDGFSRRKMILTILQKTGHPNSWFRYQTGQPAVLTVAVTNPLSWSRPSRPCSRCPSGSNLQNVAGPDTRLIGGWYPANFRVFRMHFLAGYQRFLVLNLTWKTFTKVYPGYKIDADRLMELFRGPSLLSWTRMDVTH